jgi:hypothetical protein
MMVNKLMVIEDERFEPSLGIESIVVAAAWPPPGVARIVSSDVSAGVFPE